MTKRMLIGSTVGAGIVALVIVGIAGRKNPAAPLVASPVSTLSASSFPEETPLATVELDVLRVPSPSPDPVTSAAIPSPMPAKTVTPVPKFSPTPTVSVAVSPIPTPIPTPTPVPTPTPTPKPRTHVVLMEPGRFSPTALAVRKGDTVRFDNLDTELRWPASDPHPSHTNYPAFDSKSPVEPGSSYSYTFIEAGTHSYHDHLWASILGTITVTE